MTAQAEGPRRLSDYNLVGEYAALVVEKGLADAKWYASPIPKEQMRELLERRDGPALRDTLLWFALLLAFGLAGIALWGSGWALIPFALYGVIYASSSDSRWHESSHGTAFKTDWLNNALYEIASFMVMRESTPWRWSHARHHSDTIIVGRDAEIAFPRPISIAGIDPKILQHPNDLQILPDRAAACGGPDDARRAHLHPGGGVREGVPARPHLHPHLPGRSSGWRSPRAASCR